MKNHLLVEGKSDYHVIKNLLKKHGIVIDNVIKIEGYGDQDNYMGRGIEQLKTGLTALLKGNDPLVIGVIIDADNNVNARWDSLCNLVKNQASQHNFVEFPPDSGYIATITRAPKPPLRFGIWIMPDNQDQGMLEHFVSQLIEPDDFLWKKAQGDVDAIPNDKRLFINEHGRKAQIHTWLAWQETPGRPMGIGMTAGWFDHNAPLAQSFVEWVRELFQL